MSHVSLVPHECTNACVINAAYAFRMTDASNHPIRKHEAALFITLHFLIKVPGPLHSGPLNRSGRKNKCMTACEDARATLQGWLNH